MNQSVRLRLSTSEDRLTQTVRRRIKRGPRYVKVYTDRHGRQRLYYRRKGYPGIALSGEVGSDEFRASYAAAEAAILSQEAKQQRTGGFIYAVRVRGFDLVKIGYTTSPTRRLVQLEAGSGMAGGLEMMARFHGDRSLELALHNRFRDQRLFGEWFRLSGLVEDWLATVSDDASSATLNADEIPGTPSNPPA